MKDDRVLVGDVGGTHARLAIVDVAEAAPWRLKCRLDLVEDFPTFEQALRHYLELAGIATLPPTTVIAAAGPVTAGCVNLTNRSWTVSESALRQMGFATALVINDFAALAFAAGTLDPAQLCAIGPELPGLAQQPISILGAGTGFGVSCLVRHGGRLLPVTTEGGHIAFAPADEREIAILRSLSGRFGRVSVERILSGPGLENLHQAMASLDGVRPEPLPAADIATRAMSGEVRCQASLSAFCSIFGAVAGDIALVHGARGGVLIAGGIAIKIREFLAHSAFRRRFEDKGRLAPFVTAIPTRLILDADAALRGAARAAHQSMARS